MTRMWTVALPALALLGLCAQAEAKGCIKGALVGGLAGHAAGHTVVGAATGCLAGRALADRKGRAQPPPASR